MELLQTFRLHATTEVPVSYVYHFDEIATVTCLNEVFSCKEYVVGVQVPYSYVPFRILVPDEEKDDE